jgi:hypothetical protein
MPTMKTNPWTPIAAVSSALLAVVLIVGCAVKEETVAPGTPTPAAGCAGQPNTADALGQLRDGRGWLERAEHNKGGWRDRAIAATDTAIRETQNGCNFADTH